MGCCTTLPEHSKANYNTQSYQQANAGTVTPYRSYGTKTDNAQRREQDVIEVAAEVVETCGFSVASNINKAVLLEALDSIQPSGMTALRDVIAMSAAKMLALKIMLNRLGVTGFQFIHIVLTDGYDTGSENTLKDIQEMYYEIGQKIGDNYFKTFFVGINLAYRDEQELRSIADLAGASAELFNCKDVTLSDVFDRIKLSLGIERRVAVASNGQYWAAAKQDQLFVQAHRQKFLVLFNLDMSGSMSGMRWTRLQQALSGFFTALDNTDIIGCILFNDECVCVTGKVLNDLTHS